MSEFNWDAMGKAIIELRDNGDVAAIVEDRIRGFEPGPGDGGKPYKAFVVLVMLGTLREPRVPIQRPRIGGRFYARTPQEAMALYVAASNALHHRGPRVHGNGLGIYVSHDDTGGTAERDPATGQPYVTAVFELVATTLAVT